jgi:hypothetical protein
MNDFFTLYLLAWSSACLMATGIFVYRFKTWEITRRAYWQLLLQP